MYINVIEILNECMLLDLDEGPQASPSVKLVQI